MCHDAPPVHQTVPPTIKSDMEAAFILMFLIRAFDRRSSLTEGLLCWFSRNGYLTTLPKTSYMLILLYDLVLGQYCSVFLSGCCHNDLICWVSIEWLRQGCWSIRYGWCQWYKPKFCHIQRFGNPFFWIAWDADPLFLQKLTELPWRNGRKEKWVILFWGWKQWVYPGG